MAKNNSPNENLAEVDNIIGWSVLISDRLETLKGKAETSEQKFRVNEAREQIDIMQRVDLKKLREAFE